MARRFLWLAANGVPFVMLFVLATVVVGPWSHGLVPAIAFGGFIVLVAAAQAYAWSDRRRRWFLTTLAGMTLALAIAAIVLALFDGFGNERYGIAAAHIAGGSILVLIQATALRARRRWIITGIATWIVLSVALAAAPWHPAGDVSLFAGHRELASFTFLLAGFGVATAITV